MSYNIDHVETKVLKARMNAEKMRALYEEGGLAEGNFLEEHVAAEPDINGDIKLTNFWWYGEFSGRSYEDTLLKKIVPHIQGRVDAIFYWEGGDSVSGLRINDGVAEDCAVEMVLVPKRK